MTLAALHIPFTLSPSRCQPFVLPEEIDAGYQDPQTRDGSHQKPCEEIAGDDAMKGEKLEVVR